jgi:hypothetical protein
MTIRAFEAQASWLPVVVGGRCSIVETDGGTLMSLHFGETTAAADGLIEAEHTITMQGAWRVERGGEVVAGSADPDDERSEMLSRLTGKTLERFDVSRPGYDLTLNFDDDIVIRCFPVDSLEYADDVEDPEDVEVSWWVTGREVPDDWETGRGS